MKIILVFILAVVAAAGVSLFNDSRRMRANSEELGLDALDAQVVDCSGPMLRFAVKWDEGNAYAVNDIRLRPIRIPLGAITGCEFVGGDDRSSGIGQALVGGAVMSALEGGRKGSVLRILLSDPDRPQVEFRLTKPSYAEDFRIFAREVSALVDEIKAKNEEENI